MSDKDEPLRLKGFWLLLGWVGVAVIVWQSLTVSPIELDLDNGDKFGHYAAYFCLMAWFGQIYRTPDRRNAWAVGFVAMGVALEAMQWAGGVRFFELADIGANLAGVALGWLVSRTAFSELLLRLEAWMSV